MEVRKTEYESGNERYLDMQLLERRYASENAMMKAVVAGNCDEVERLVTDIMGMGLDKRQESALRDCKNNLIILNTLLRKAAEYGAVHPIYIDALSHRYAIRIEELISTDITAFIRRMIQEYCLLVQEHSLKGYSPIVQKVVNQIHMNIAGELSLKTLSAQFNVSSGYLSTLFKKEVGDTLTNYINNKRLDYGTALLERTTLSIQDIAVQCGFADANYFIRLFKRRQGVTPRQYRELGGR